MSENIFLDEEKSLPAFFTYPDEEKHPSIILIHEIWGLNDNIKDISQRFKKEGYVVLAPDLFYDTPLKEVITPALFKETINPQTRDEAQKKMRASLAPTQSPEFAENMMKKMQNCFDYLKNSNKCNGKIIVIGFCFGGTYSFALATEQPKLQGAIPFYGHSPQPLDKVERINCPILAFYGEQDTALMEALPNLKEAMKKSNKDFEAIVYPDTGHAFFNDQNKSRYNERAAKDAWQKTLEFLNKIFSK